MRKNIPHGGGIVIALFFSADIWVMIFGGIAIYQQQPAEQGSCRDEFGRSCEVTK